MGLTVSRRGGQEVICECKCGRVTSIKMVRANTTATGGRADLYITAPLEVAIYRKELLDKQAATLRKEYMDGEAFTDEGTAANRTDVG